MSVPATYSSTEEYLEVVFDFLKKYKWLYHSKNTDILSKHVLSNFSDEWIAYFNYLSVQDLHKLVEGHVKDDAPSSFKVFIDELNNLKPQTDINPPSDKNIRNISGISDKKMHEIALLAPVINEVYQKTGCDLIVDIGSGLGYLPHLLYEEYSSSVLGLEASQKYVKLAQQNQEKQHPRSKTSVKFCEMYVNENSNDEVEKLIEENFDTGKTVCVIGLHACADLSIEVLELFIKMKCAKSLVIMPCCYHRIKVAKEEPDRIYFKNFPASEIIRNFFKKYDAHAFIGLPFLRLACQQTLKSFITMTREEHTSHSFQCMSRAILQLVAEMENCDVRRLKRKSGKSNATDSDEGFQTYLNNLETTHKLEVVGPNRKNPIKITDEAFLLKMQEKWNENKGDCWLVEVLMGLQAAIQSICENVILLDRIQFLKEKGFHCYYRKITNDIVSPRCWALIAKKNP